MKNSKNPTSRSTTIVTEGLKVSWYNKKYPMIRLDFNSGAVTVMPTQERHCLTETALLNNRLKNQRQVGVGIMSGAKSISIQT